MIDFSDLNSMAQEKVSKEIEQRYIIDPFKWLYLPRKYLEYHQAELGSWLASEVIGTFKDKTRGLLLWDELTTGRKIETLFSSIQKTQQIKLRIRRIFDPREFSLRAELTLKEKLPNKDNFKIYKEHNIPINPILGLGIIEHIAPWHEVTNHQKEHGVRKFRYNVGWPDEKIWDVDVLQWLNAWVHIGEIEVWTTKVKINVPPWAVKRVNWDPTFHFLWTKELQETPFSRLPAKIKAPYLQSLGFKIIG